MTCPNCGKAMVLYSQNDYQFVYICSKCKYQVVESRD